MKVALSCAGTAAIFAAVAFLALDAPQAVRAVQADPQTQAASTAPKVQTVTDPDGAIITSEKQKFKIEVVIRDLETPWGMAFEPGGKLLITERSGHIRIYDKGKLSEPVKGTPVPRVQQDAGYFDISLHPQFAQERVDISVLCGGPAGLDADCGGYSGAAFPGPI